MLVALILAVYAIKILLTSTWWTVTMTCTFMHANACLYTRIILSSVLFFMGWTQVEFPSILCRIIW